MDEVDDLSLELSDNGDDDEEVLTQPTENQDDVEEEEEEEEERLKRMSKESVIRLVRVLQDMEKLREEENHTLKMNLQKLNLEYQTVKQQLRDVMSSNRILHRDIFDMTKKYNAQDREQEERVQYAMNEKEKWKKRAIAQHIRKRN